MGERYSLETFIEAEVKKAMENAKPATSTGGIFDGITLNDITKFMSELQKLKAQMSSTTPQAPTPLPPSTGPSPRAAPALNPDAVYGGILRGIDMIIPVLGDVKLSELKAYMTENKEAVVALIGGAMK